MFRRLAPVIELSESCSESPSPAHKRSQTQDKTRFATPGNSNQVWQLIQSRRNLDKKIRLVKSRVVTSSDKARKKFSESPCNRTLNECSAEKRKMYLKPKSIHEKNKENREKLVKKAEQTRMEVKLQSAIDLDFIKKRNEMIAQQKRDNVSLIKNSLVRSRKNIKSQVLREIGSSAKTEKKINTGRSQSVHYRKYDQKNFRSLSVLVSPRNLF